MSFCMDYNKKEVTAEILAWCSEIGSRGNAEMQEDNVSMKKWLSLLLVMTMLCAGAIQAQAAGTVCLPLEQI